MWQLITDVTALIAKKLDDQRMASVATFYREVRVIGEPMSESSIESHSSAAASPEHVAAPISAEAAAVALRHGPRGALIVAGIAVSLLLAGWLAFYFLLFLPRGAVG